MKYKLSHVRTHFLDFNNSSVFKEGILVIGCFEDKVLPFNASSYIDISLFLKGLQSTSFQGKIGETLVFPYPVSGPFHHIILLGLGSLPLDSLQAEKAGASLYKILESLPSSSPITFHLENALGSTPAHVLYGCLLRSWKFEKYRTSVLQKYPFDSFTILCSHPEEAVHKFERLKHIIEGVFLAREVISEPSNYMTPKDFVTRAQELLDLGIEVEVLNESRLKELGFRTLLAVGQGSANPPYVLILKWTNAPIEDAPLAFVGKGVCFDAGGISLKPPLHMHEMKWDMAGGAAVLGALYTIAAQKLPINVIGIIGLVENMPDGKSLKPGDIITSLSGKTIEVVDTDAEGRLVLADCLWYAQTQFKPKYMIDLATLTIETVASLAHEYAGLFSNDDTLANLLTDSGQKCAEKVWRLPLGNHLAKQIESDYADMKNLGEAYAGENGAAAEFLKNFVGSTPWAHLDIAGVAWSKEDTIYARKGVTGFGVKLLEELAYHF
jgi:leucyl aminopeptidase